MDHHFRHVHFFLVTTIFVSISVFNFILTICSIYIFIISGIKPYTGLVQTMTSIAGKEGVKGLFQGFSPYYLRCGGQTLLMFMSVEWLRKIYQAVK